MTGDGAQCDDVDECKVPGACFSDCVNITPGYECGSCPAGYYGNAPSGNVSYFMKFQGCWLLNTDLCSSFVRKTTIGVIIVVFLTKLSHLLVVKTSSSSKINISKFKPGLSATLVSQGIGIEYARNNPQQCLDVDECATNNGQCGDHYQCK